MSRPVWFTPVLRALFAASLLTAAATSLWLDKNADRARQREQALRWAEFAAVLAGQVSAEGTVAVEAAVTALVRTQPGLAYLRVEAPDGRLVAQAGEEKGGLVALDRTLVGKGGPLRVRVACVPVYRPVAWGVRAAFWVLLLVGFEVSVLTLLGREGRRRREGGSRLGPGG